MTFKPPNQVLHNDIFPIHCVYILTLECKTNTKTKKIGPLMGLGPKPSPIPNTLRARPVVACTNGLP
ncbi:hypothetical protein HanRHA438_Chr11g0494541 [Helianthus annuus]|nr:hypothetical protein HanRHA438_Chr11g0494541 [Helianthus annuus]